MGEKTSEGGPICRRASPSLSYENLPRGRKHGGKTRKIETTKADLPIGRKRDNLKKGSRSQMQNSGSRPPPPPPRPLLPKGDGTVVRAPASHQRGPGSIPGLGVICGLSLLLILVPASRVFLRVLQVFLPP